MIESSSKEYDSIELKASIIVVQKEDIENNFPSFFGHIVPEIAAFNGFFLVGYSIFFSV